MNDIKAHLKAMICVYLTQAATIMETLETSLNPAASGYTGPVDALISAVADRIARIVAANQATGNQVEAVDVDFDINGFCDGPLPCKVPVLTNAQKIEDYICWDAEMLEKICHFLLRSVES